MTELCPRCGKNEYTPYGVEWTPNGPPRPALSRMDNKTHICDPCGTDEAMRDFFGGHPIPPNEWPIKEGE